MTERGTSVPRAGSVTALAMKRQPAPVLDEIC